VEVVVEVEMVLHQQVGLGAPVAVKVIVQQWPVQEIHHLQHLAKETAGDQSQVVARLRRPEVEVVQGKQVIPTVIVKVATV